MPKTKRRPINVKFVITNVLIALVGILFVVNTILSAYTNYRLYVQSTGVKSGTWSISRAQLIDFVVGQEVRRILKENEANKKNTPNSVPAQPQK